MNDDRKFQQMSESITVLFENSLPAKVIAEALGISYGTVMKYRKKLQGKISITCGKKDLYGHMLLVLRYLPGQENILVQAANIFLETKRVDDIVLGMSLAYPAIIVPQFNESDELVVAHLRLLEVVLEKNIIDPFAVNLALPSSLREALMYFEEKDLKKIQNQDELLSSISKRLAQKKSSEFCHFVLNGDYLFETIEEVLQTLSSKELEVLSQRFGLYGETMSFQEIADKHDITRNRTVQIYDKALRRLRHPSRRLTLLSLLNSRGLERHLRQKIRELDYENKVLVEHFEGENINLHELDLSVRALKLLQQAKITTLGQLLSYRVVDLLEFNFGKRTLNEIELLLKERGLELPK